MLLGALLFSMVSACVGTMVKSRFPQVCVVSHMSNVVIIGGKLVNAHVITDHLHLEGRWRGHVTAL